MTVRRLPIGGSRRPQGRLIPQTQDAWQQIPSSISPPLQSREHPGEGNLVPRRHVSWAFAAALALVATACSGSTAATTSSTAATATLATTTTSTTAATTTTTTTTTPPTTTTTAPALTIVDGPIQADARVVDWDSFYAEGGTSVPGVLEVFVGSGDDVVDLQQGLPVAVVSLSHRGESNFIVHAIFSDGSDDGLVNEIGPYEGRTLAFRSNAELTGLEIRADGDWVAIAMNLGLAETGTEDARSYEGVGDSVIVFPSVIQSGFEPLTAFSKVTLTHDGGSNFIVHELAGPGLVSEIGSYSGTVRLSPGGIFGLVIIADGAWTVSFG